MAASHTLSRTTRTQTGLELKQLQQLRLTGDGVLLSAVNQLVERGRVFLYVCFFTTFGLLSMVQKPRSVAMFPPRQL
jgi:hypothetical protein